jgi:hypothetical protein
MSLAERHTKALRKKARHGFRGYPVATVAYYGPDARRASKVAVAIIPEEDAEPTTLERWFNEQRKVRDASREKANANNSGHRRRRAARRTRDRAATETGDR